MIATSLFTLVSVITTVSAQGWRFTTAPEGGQIAACQSLPITLDGSGNGPYYLIAFAKDAVPFTSLVGTNPGSLAYTPIHPPGTTVILSMLNSAGAPLGTSATQYTVTEGQNKNCVNAALSGNTDFTVRTNATAGTISTCEPWGLRIQGGKPPYSLSIVALDSMAMTNVTMEPTQDAYTYINRASPQGTLAAAIFDSTGRWASGTPVVKTEGATDTECGGAQSSGGRAADFGDAPPATSSGTTRTTSPATTTALPSVSRTTDTAANTQLPNGTNPPTSETTDLTTPDSGSVSVRQASSVMVGILFSVSALVMF